jgi:hypothetical protein
MQAGVLNRQAMSHLSHDMAYIIILLEVIPFHLEDRYHHCRATCSYCNLLAGRVVCETQGCPDIRSGDRKGL